MKAQEKLEKAVAEAEASLKKVHDDVVNRLSKEVTDTKAAAAKAIDDAVQNVIQAHKKEILATIFITFIVGFVAGIATYAGLMHYFGVK